MAVGAYCVHKVVTAQPEDTVATAAQRMAQHDVEVLVVTEDQQPVGIVTERDLVLQALATGGDPQSVTLRTVMSSSLLCVSDTVSLEEAVALMRTYHLRRLVIVNEAGELVGVVSLDGRIRRRLEGQQPHLGAIAMRDDELMLARQGRQYLRSLLNVLALHLGRHRLAPLQQGIASQGNNHTHQAPPVVSVPLSCGRSASRSALTPTRQTTVHSEVNHGEDATACPWTGGASCVWDDETVRPYVAPRNPSTAAIPTAYQGYCCVHQQF